jgi:hypothetical protein
MNRRIPVGDEPNIAESRNLPLRRLIIRVRRCWNRQERVRELFGGRRMRDANWQDYRAGNVAPTDIWIVGDGPCVDGQLAAEMAGMRVARRMTCAEGNAALDAGSAELPVLVELSKMLSTDEEALIDRIARSAGATVVAAPLTVIDAVASRLFGVSVTILCEPELSDQIAAITLARAPVGGRLAERDDRTAAIRLSRLTSEVARIAQVLAGLADQAMADPSRAVPAGLTGYRPPLDGVGTVAVTANDIRTMIRFRRQRESVFGDGIFGDPVWDMMLDLAASRLDGTQVAVSSLCIAAAVPPTTALRWIAALTEAGTIVRVPDANDRRRVFLELSDAAAAAVLDFLGRAKSAGAALL